MPWWPSDQWEQMVAGVGCPMCADAHLSTNDHSDLVMASDVSYIRLHHNQSHTGYSVVILRRHVAEVHDLEEAEYDAFWHDVRRTSRAVANLFRPAKIDTLVMGHLCPHVHCHVYPQYPEHDPGALVDLQKGAVQCSAGEQAARVRQLRAALGDPPRR